VTGVQTCALPICKEANANVFTNTNTNVFANTNDGNQAEKIVSRLFSTEFA